MLCAYPFDAYSRNFPQYRNKLATTTYRQDRALYAFTIVTIIFLPLSFVATVFGMNTSDVRDMEMGQWAYWSTAVPITAVVVFLGLLWTGELHTLESWTKPFFGGGGDGRGRLFKVHKKKVADPEYP